MKKICILACLLFSFMFFSLTGCSNVGDNSSTNEECTSFKVTFNGEGGTLTSGKEEQQICNYDDIKEPSYSKPGYTFGGWDTELKTVNKETTIKAEWNIINHSIVYHLDNGMNGNNPASYTIEDSNIILEDASKTGFTFNGWYTESTFENKIKTINVSELKHYNLYAKFTINQYTIAFNSNGGSAISPIVQNYNTAITEPQQPTKDGYVFDGWYTDNVTFLNRYQFTTMPLNGIELYAKFIINQYTIAFNSNGGTAVSPIIQNYDTVVTEPEEPTREGYTFGGWYTDNGTFLNEYEFTTMPVDGIELYAKWNIDVYTINYYLYEGINGNNPTEYTIEDSNIVLEEASKVGFTFNGWYKEPTFANMITTINVSELKHYNLYAKFTINQYTIAFNSNGGTKVSPITQNYNTIVSEPSEPIKEGYTFDGWYTDNVTFLNEYEFTTMPVDGIELYAKFTINQYTISFRSNGGSDVSDITQDYNSVVDEPHQPIRDGYAFRGWYSDNGTFLNEYEFNEMPSENLILYAMWTNLFIIEGHTITGLSSYALSLKYIAIPSAIDEVYINEIGPNAFNKNGIMVESLEISTTIGVIDATFQNCNKLKNVYYQSTLEDWSGIRFSAKESNPMYYAQHFFIKNGTNEWEEVTKIELKSNIQTLGKYAFAGFSNVTDIIIPSSITTIGSYVFTSYQGNKIVISKSVETIERNAFTYSTADIIFEENSNVSRFLQHAFNLYMGKNIEIPASLKLIERYAFNANDNLENVYYHSTFEKWKEILCEDSAWGPMIDAEHLFVKGEIGQWEEVTRIVIDDSFELVNGQMIAYLRNVSEVLISASVKQISGGVFYKYENLENVYYESTLEDWNKIVFDNTHDNPMYWGKHFFIKDHLGEWEEVIRIELGDSVDSIGKFAFVGFPNVTDIVIPETVTSIGLASFMKMNDGNLENVYYKSTLENWNKITFNSVESNPMYYAQHFFIMNDRLGEWEEVIRIELDDSVTELGAYVFAGFPNVKEIKFPDSLTNIGSRSFSNYKGNEIVIPANVTAIGDYAFDGVTAKISFESGTTMSTIGDHAFYNYKGNELIIPKSVTSIGYGAFWISTAKISFEEGSAITTIEYGAFRYFKGTVIIPKTITTIENRAFEDSTASVIFEDGVTTISTQAFWNYKGEQIILPTSITTIEYLAFKDSSLKKVYYKGTKEQFSNIKFGTNNVVFANATKYYYVENEEDVPNDGEKYWHYDADGITPIEWVIE